MSTDIAVGVWLTALAYIYARSSLSTSISQLCVAVTLQLRYYLYQYIKLNVYMFVSEWICLIVTDKVRFLAVYFHLHDIYTVSRKKLTPCIHCRNSVSFKTAKRSQAPGGATVMKRVFRDNFVIFHRIDQTNSIFEISEFLGSTP